MAFGKLALVQPSKGSTHTSMTNPPVAKLPIAPIFIAEKVSLAVSCEKDGKLRIVYAGSDEAKLLLLGTPLTG